MKAKKARWSVKAGVVLVGGLYTCLQHFTMTCCCATLLPPNFSTHHVILHFWEVWTEKKKKVEREEWKTGEGAGGWA